MASLDSARLKIDWANKHLESLKLEVLRYLNEKTHDIDGHFESHIDGDRLAVKFRQGKAVPPAISLTYGDCIQQLRSALDYLVWELVLAAKNNPTEQNMFPICAVEKSFTDAIKGGRLAGISVDAIAEIKALQPYQNREPSRDMLFGLNELSRIDKHRRILLAIPGVAGGRAIFTTSDGRRSESEITPGYDGAKIADGPSGVREGQKVRMQGQAVLYVAVQESVAQDMEVTETVSRLVSYVSFVVGRFEKFF